MRVSKTVVIFLLLLFFHSFIGGDSVEQKFWTWFKKHEKDIYQLDINKKNRDSIFARISRELDKVHSDLTFELSMIKKNGKREFIISAGGIKTAFPAVESLFNAAPILPRWEFIKFRPRMEELGTIEMKGIVIKPGDVYYKMYRDDQKVGLILFFDGYNEKDKNFYITIGFLFLDQALGEYDVATRIGFIEFQNRQSKYFNGAESILTLPDRFDTYFKQKH